MEFEERWELLQKSSRESSETLMGPTAWAYTDRIDETFYLTPEGKRVTLYGFEPYAHRAFLIDAGFVAEPVDEDGVEYPIAWLDFDEDDGSYLEDRLVVDVCAEGWVRRSTSIIFSDAPVSYTVKGPPSRLSDALAKAAGEDMDRGVRVTVEFVQHAESGIELESLDLDEALQLKK